MSLADWMHDAAEAWSGGPEAICDAGHGSHDTIDLTVRLDGPTPRVPDTPGVPPDHARDLHLAVYDWRRYLDVDVEYCAGRDVISESIDTQGMWEGFQTAVALEIVDDDAPGLVIDIGSHVGWYSVLAAQSERPVLAVDADPGNACMTATNAGRNGVAPLVTVCRGWVGPDTPTLPPLSDGERVRLVKCDIEGAEDHAVRALLPLLAAGLVDFVLMEVSPCFADHYPATCATVEACGFEAFLIPGKGTALGPYEADPLGSMERLTGFDFDQRDVLFRHYSA